MTTPRANAESLVECLINSAIDVGCTSCSTSGDLLGQQVRQQLLDYNENKLMKQILSEEDYEAWSKEH